MKSVPKQTKRKLRVAAFLLPLLLSFGAAADPAPFRTRLGEAAPAALVAALPPAPDARARIVVLGAEDSPASREFVLQLDAALAPLCSTGRAQTIVIARGADDIKALAWKNDVAPKSDLKFLPDPARAVFNSVAESGVPRVLILDQQNRLVWQQSGVRADTAAQLRTMLEAWHQGQAWDEAIRQFGQAPAAIATAATGSLVGQPAPEVPVEVWINPLPEDRAGKFVLVEFWETTCSPCIMAMRMAEKQHHLFEARLVTMAISPEDEDRVRRFVEMNKFKLPIGVDTAARAMRSLNITAIPQAHLVNPEGRVVWEGNPLSLWASDGRLLRTLIEGKPRGPQT